MGNSLGDLIRFFALQRMNGFEPPVAPMLEEQVINRLKHELASASLYLEFGSGGSTVLADQMGVEGISVESDRFYADVVRARLVTGGMEIITPRIGITGPFGWPLLKYPTTGRLRRWRRYVQEPFERFGSRFPDLIMVDGRFRVACALETARRAHDSGHRAKLIFDDYALRPKYHVVAGHLGTPELVGRTAFFEIGHARVPLSAIETAIHDPL
ncbi:MAG: hypothetical protein ABI454_12955 [Sphingomicrobium sp.]